MQQLHNEATFALVRHAPWPDIDYAVVNDLVLAGSHVKLEFRTSYYLVRTEELWVSVLGRTTEGKIAGTIANYPGFARNFAFGDFVEFAHCDIRALQVITR